MKAKYSLAMLYNVTIMMFYATRSPERKALIRRGDAFFSSNAYNNIFPKKIKRLFNLSHGDTAVICDG